MQNNVMAGQQSRTSLVKKINTVQNNNIKAAPTAMQIFFFLFSVKFFLEISDTINKFISLPLQIWHVFKLSFSKLKKIDLKLFIDHKIFGTSIHVFD